MCKVDIMYSCTIFTIFILCLLSNYIFSRYRISFKNIQSVEMLTLNLSTVAEIKLSESVFSIYDKILKTWYELG